MTRRPILALAVLAALLTSPAGAAVPAEYQLKAAFVFNFTQFVEWPSTAFSTADAPFVICIAGDDPFGQALDQIVEGEAVGRHRIVVHRVSDALNLPPCHLVFLSRSAQKNLDAVLDRISPGASVLTVSDIERFVARGGAIGLFLDRNHVRFEIGVKAAENQRLKLSSQLLSLGRIAQPETRERRR
ncbi:MAG TPA: YfiR family protein [Thermoanaerobaculia bacterium]|nr:YfiR family protein [Thermoanaerobaculia bacterium]